MNKEIINQMKKRIVILGAGESGAGAAVLAKAKGFNVFVSDFSSIKPKYKDMLDAHGICWEEGRHTEADILNADEIIKSPGIPDKAPIIKKLKEKGTPIISEIEFAGRYTDAKMICITGSNGKTTTTMLTYHILRQAGVDAGLAGNVGNSLALQVAEDPHAVYVIELVITTRCRTMWMPNSALSGTRRLKMLSYSGTTIPLLPAKSPNAIRRQLSTRSPKLTKPA